MKNCRYREENICKLSSDINNKETIISDKICSLCQSCGEPTENNEIILKLTNFGVKVNNINKDCKHIGKKVGEMNCKCQGQKDVYACGLHKYCAKRQLVSNPTININNETIRHKLQYCRFCEDYLENTE